MHYKSAFTTLVSSFPQTKFSKEVLLITVVVLVILALDILVLERLKDLITTGEHGPACAGLGLSVFFLPFPFLKTGV